MRRSSASRIYRGLLRLFPPGFRARRSGDLERLFEHMWDEREGTGGKPGPAFWLRLTGDTLRAAGAEWASLLRDRMRRDDPAREGMMMGALVNDLRYALRQLVRRPGYALTVVLLMAVGIAGNAAVFRVVNGLFLRPLPFPEADRLVDLDERAPAWNLEYVSIATPNFLAWRSGNRTFASMATYRSGAGNLVQDGTPRRLRYLLATHDIDDVLGIEPVLGRFFEPGEDEPGAPRVALLTRAYWEQAFGSDPQVVGRTLQLDGDPVEVIGVLPATARFVGEVDAWMPLRDDPDNRRGWWLNGVGRLAPGVTVEQARDDLRRIHATIEDDRVAPGITSPVVQPLPDRFLGSYRPGAGALLSAVAVVLLLACANIAALMTARALDRADEIALRRALGAPRGRIVRQLLVEAGLLGLLGAAAGTALGVWGSDRLVGPLTDGLPAWISLDLDARFVAFTLLVTLAATLGAAIVPALRATSRASRLAATTRVTGSAGRRRAMSALVAGEVALSLALLVVGGLTFLDVRRMVSAHPGYETDARVAFNVSLPSSTYPDAEARLGFAERYLERLEALPGVASAAVTSGLPLNGHWGWFFQAEGAPPRPEDEPDPVVLNRAVSPGYFETMGIELRAGRLFDELDGRDPDADAVIVVNETFVRTHLGHLDDPVGARLTPGTGTPDDDDRRYVVVGVVRDVLHYGADQPMRPGIYQPVSQIPLSALQVVAHLQGAGAATAGTLRAATAEIDPALPVDRFRTLGEDLDEAMFTRRALAWMIGTFSVVALILAVAGLHGVIAYDTGARTREIGIRMAVGAQREAVVGRVMARGMAMVLVGTAVGLVLSLGIARSVGAILVRVPATEPTVYLAVTALLVGVAALANWLPARRAAAMDVVQTLRAE